MSKAFTKEDDSALPELPKPIAVRPPGTRNLITSAGAARLRADLVDLLDRQRPPLVAAPADDTDAKHELQLVDRKIQQLQESLAAAEVVAPPPPPHDTVQFGSTIAIREPDGEVSNYTIVGVDEADFSAGRISWLSPLARALMHGRIGESVSFQAPAGIRQLMILAISYPDEEPI